jgi:nitroreductase
VIRSDEGKSKIRACYDREWFATAPLYILGCADHNTSWKRPFDGKDHADIDIAIATEHICLAAAELNLGTCWVCHFDTQQCKKAFKLPQGIEPVVILPIGYPDTDDAFTTATRMSRKTLEQVVVYE